MGPLASTLAVLLAGASTASGTVFSLTETYNVTNFFDRFDFFESKFGTNDISDQDPTGGFVNYKGRDAAMASGLVSNHTGDVYIGVDSVNKWWSPDGRSSIRLESKKDYTKGLFIARFNHLPKAACGAWPAFWMYSKVGSWPNGGEIDMYENWNLATHNHPAVHTGNIPDVGRCEIDSTGATGTLLRSDCSHDLYNIGCNVVDTKGPWGSSSGGIYAMEWTDSHIRIFTWSPADAPRNIDSAHPDTAAWGKPVFELRDGPCNIKRQFAPQKLILNIDFCGAAAGQTSLWEECAAVTGEKECNQYVRNNPGAYKDVYWKVKDIRYFEEGSKPDPTSSSSTKTSTSTTSSSSITSTSSITRHTTSVTTSSSVPLTSLSSVTSSVSTFSPNSSIISSSHSTIPANSTPISITTGSSSSSGSDASSAPHLTTSSQEWTTSTVYTTRTYTITSCASTVTNCPGKGHVVTETIPLYTTICPVTPPATTTATATSLPSVSAPSQPETSITKVTKIYTITSCAPAVTNCPVGKVTTEVVTSTICRECTANNTKKPSTSSADMGCHGDNCASGVALLMEQSATIIAPSSVATASSSIQKQLSTGASTGESRVVTSAPSRVASTGIVSVGTHQPTMSKPTGTQSQVPVAGLGIPTKSVSKGIVLLAGILVATLVF